jgi:hypothetical protein
MDWEDRLAIVIIGEILFEHLQEQEDPKDPALLPTDRLRGAIDSIIQGLDREKKRRFKNDNDD